MSDRSIRIVATGVANTASVAAAFRRAGFTPTLTADPDEVARATRVVLPGVGAFGTAMERLRTTGLADAIRERFAADRPLLAICLGLQLLARQSAESPAVAGMGALGADVIRFGPGVRVPQLGWNRVTPAAGARLLEPGHAFFANSYHLDHVPPGTIGAMSEHGGPFVAAVERGSFLGCQFHPELSGDWGEALIARWGARC